MAELDFNERHNLVDQAMRIYEVVGNNSDGLLKILAIYSQLADLHGERLMLESTLAVKIADLDDKVQKLSPEKVDRAVRDLEKLYWEMRSGTYTKGDVIPVP